MKTSEVRSLLDHIPQGVLSIGKNGLIEKDFSAHLTQILGTSDIAGRSFKGLVLKASDFSLDMQDQIWQTLLSCLGESELNYELNADKLPNALVLDPGGRPRNLKATWNIQVQNDTIEHILVTLLDVTHEKAMEQAAAGHQQELSIIDELVQVPASKVAQFFETSLPLLKENEKLIEGTEVLSEHAVKLLFVNAHTVKGAARSLQFKGLAQVIHEAEEAYSRALKDREQPSRERLKADIEKIMNHFAIYGEINRNKLNRSEDFRKVTVDRDQIEQLHASLLHLAARPDLSMERLIEEIDRQSEALSSMIFERSLPIFEDYRERALSIARDLGKVPPEVHLEIDDFSVSPAVQSTLSRCMVHFLRNALDHGIETAEERRALGKDPAGSIRMRCHVKDRQLHLILGDDGRGLAIQRLRDKAFRAGRATADMNTEAIAHLIFEAGFSTAEVVSDISGRGVGLHAVRSFVEKQGGTVAIKLEGPLDPAGEYHRFHFELTLPLILQDARNESHGLPQAV